MRVLHVVGGMAPDNRFGGVTRVAIELARRQRQLGMSAVLAGAGMGYRRLPDRLDGVPVLMAKGMNPVPRLGLGAVIAPGLLLKLVRPMLTADLVHVHLGRDAVSLPAALLARLLRRPVVAQTHGMLDAPRDIFARLVDRLLTRPALRGAGVALVLIDAEREQIGELTGGRLRTEVFANGVSLPEAAQPWQHRSEEVVFLARLHPRKGAVRFAQAALALADRFPRHRFRILGPDEGDAPAVQRLLDLHANPAAITVEGAIPHDVALQQLAAAQVLVLPAVDEPFGMTLLESMAAGTPVVVHESAALAPVIDHAGGGTEFGRASARSLEVALSTLLEEGSWTAASASARSLVEERFTIDAVIARLGAHYAEVLAESTGARARGRHGSDSTYEPTR